MVLTSRGALRSCDQNLGICTRGGTGPITDANPFLAIQTYQPSPVLRQILALQNAPVGSLTPPTGLTATLASGGTLPVGDTFYYVVTSIDGAGGESIASSEASQTTTSGNQTINLAWTAIPGAVSYNVYRATSSGNEVLLAGSGLPATVTGYSDNGSATVVSSGYTITRASAVGSRYPNPSGGGYSYNTAFFFYLASAPPIGPTGPFTVTGSSNALFNANYPSGVATAGATITYSLPGSYINETGTGGTLTLASGGGGGSIRPPTSGTSSLLDLLDVSGASYSFPDSVIASFPTGSIIPMPVFPVGSAGGSSQAPGGGTALNPAAGNVAGATCVIPDMVAFSGLLILALGNGYAPYQSDGTNGGTVALTNTFTGAFPGWVATTAYNLGDIIEPDTPNGHIYKCIQAGISNTSEPTWPTGSGQTVQDHTCIWQENGSNATPAPRGAAHAISHAGSLWLWNTSPANTSDNLDGPSVLKMSDANNPDSWNPLNVSYVGKDDGQQGMGLASFTIAEAGIEPTESLVLFKEFSTYQVIGVFGASDFEIQQAQTNLGCIAPRTIKFVPGFGIVRLTHLGFAVFDGVRDRLISEEIRPYLFGGVADIVAMDQSYSYMAKADLTAVPPMYVAAIPVLGNGQNGSLTRLCCYDLVLKAWTIIDIPFAIESLKQLNIPGSLPLTVFGGWADSMISRWQVGDQQGWQAWLDPTQIIHQGTQLVWSIRTPSALGAQATDRVTFRRLIVRGQWQGTNTSGPGQPLIPTNSTGTASFSTSITIDKANWPNAPARNLLTPTGGVGDASFELVCEIGQTGLDAYATVGGIQALSGAPVEIIETDWLAIARPTGALSRV
jgi:hypothetical protein